MSLVVISKSMPLRLKYFLIHACKQIRYSWVWQVCKRKETCVLFHSCIRSRGLNFQEGVPLTLPLPPSRSAGQPPDGGWEDGVPPEQSVSRFLCSFEVTVRLQSFFDRITISIRLVRCISTPRIPTKCVANCDELAFQPSRVSSNAFFRHILQKPGCGMCDPTWLRIQTMQLGLETKWDIFEAILSFSICAWKMKTGS